MKDDTVTCEEAREVAQVGFPLEAEAYLKVLLRFIDQAELLEADHARLRIALNARRLHLDEVRAEYRQLAEENARLRAACVAALQAIDQAAYDVRIAQILREALEQE